VSAPGKVLLAGGYLVLESPNVGLVLAVNKRFYCTVTSSTSATTPPSPCCTIQVDSPQFHSTWTYELVSSSSKQTGISLVPSSLNRSSNAFVEKSLRVVCAYLHAINGTGTTIPFPSMLNIRILADNDFYSVVPHLESTTAAAISYNANTRFKPCPTNHDGTPIVHKTGLGSSAALVTSLVGALLTHFKTTMDRNHAYNLAQLCHCHAQGKVGSGFDVSCAIHGSHVYQRFPKCILSDVLTHLDHISDGDATAVCEDTCQLVKTTIDTVWSGGVVAPMQLPRGLGLLLADVCGGSESPSMASKVLNWKMTAVQDDISDNYWEQLAILNSHIIDLFHQLTKQDDDLTPCALTCAKDWQHQYTTLFQLHVALAQSRFLLRSMGEAAGVPIEPPPQTTLANATMELPGVVTTLVPGAGGYDAVACLYVNGVRDDIKQFWKKWDTVSPLNVEAVDFGEGLRVEHDFDV